MVTPKLSTSQTITLAAAAACLTCACGIGYRDTSPPPPPPPVTALSVYPASLAFPATTNLTESQPLEFTVTNDYDRPVFVSVALSPADRTSFRFGRERCFKSLDPRETCILHVIYVPTAVGPTHGRLLVHVMGGYSIPVELTGTSVAP